MSFLQELKRRNVAKVAALYVVAGWLVLQAAELLFGAMNVPEEWLRFLIAILALGLPPVLIFSWVFEITSEGVKREKDIDRSESITPQTGRRINTVIILLLVVAVAAVVVDRLIPEKAAEPVVEDVGEVTVVATAMNSIAVLPFKDLSAEGNQEYFSEGIAEEILNVLVRVEGLEVASRTTSFGFKGQEALGIPLIAKRMSVRHVLEGSVRKSGDMVRITAQLIDAQSDKHLWSETYDRTLTAESIFAIQDEIAAAIVKQLGAIMGTTRRASADTENLEAYELYLQAHKLFIERSDVLKSIELFEKTVAADPAFARAWVGLAAAYVVAPGWVFRADRDYPELAKSAADMAIALDPDLALSYAVLGYGIWEQDFDAALANFDKALQRDEKETSVLLWRAALFVDLGYFDRAARDFVSCLKIDPAYEMCRNLLATTKLYSGDVVEAIRLYEHGLRRGFRANSLSFSYSWIAHGNSSAALLNMSYANNLYGSNEFIEPTFKAMSDRNFEFENVQGSIEVLYQAVTGEVLDWTKEENLALAFRNYAAIVNSTETPFWWYPYPEDLKQSPHRKRMIRDFGIFDYWQKHGYPPQCRPIGDDDFECD